jgi:hypothetical protein
MLGIADDRRNDWIVQRCEDGSTEKILDPERVNRARLRFKARRWLLSKMLPRTFGDPLFRNAPQETSSDMAENDETARRPHPRTAQRR